MLKNLLVVLSLAAVPCAPTPDDKHKQPSGRTGKSRFDGAMRFVARAYSSGRLTADGSTPVAGLTIAADPAVIPMGSRVKVNGAGPYSGVYKVQDVGPGIKGRSVDIYMKSYDEAVQFGRRLVQISVLHMPRKRPRPTRAPQWSAAVHPIAQQAAPQGASIAN